MEALQCCQIDRIGLHIFNDGLVETRSGSVARLFQERYKYVCCSTGGVCNASNSNLEKLSFVLRLCNRRFASGGGAGSGRPALRRRGRPAAAVGRPVLAAAIGSRCRTPGRRRPIANGSSSVLVSSPNTQRNSITFFFTRAKRSKKATTTRTASHWPTRPSTRR